MKQEFTQENITLSEIKAIKEWTEDSSNIKATMWGLNDKKTKEAHLLFALFGKYKSNVPKYIKLYRGMAFDGDEYNRFGYAIIKKENYFIPDDSAIGSFSYSKKVSKKYAEDYQDRKYKVILSIDSNNNMLDITGWSIRKNEKEVLLNKNIKFMVKYTKEIKIGEYIW